MTLDSRTRCHLLTKHLATTLKLLGVVGLLAGLAAAAAQKPVRDRVAATLASLGDMPPAGAVALLLVLYAAANAPTMLPTNALHVTCGVLFGLYAGTAVALACYTVTAFLPYAAVRGCFRERVHAWLAGSKYYALVDVIDERPLFMLLCTCCSPVVPGSLNNLLFGLCEVGPGTYLAGSALGIAPQLVFYVYIGTVVGDLSRLDDALTHVSAGKAALLALGGAVTVAMLVWVGVKANAVVNKTLGGPGVDTAEGAVPPHDRLVEVVVAE